MAGWLDSWMAGWRNRLNSLFVKIRVIRGQTLPLHPNEIPLYVRDDDK
jgi:hypothetical protein